MKLALTALAWLWIATASASAQAGHHAAAPNAKRELLRISLGAGLSIASAPLRRSMARGSRMRPPEVCRCPTQWRASSWC